MGSGELTSTNGTVVWDGIGVLRLRYDGTRAGPDALTSSLRTRLGERVLPVEALQAVEVGPSGLKLVLRDGADPLQSVSGGHVVMDPYDFPEVDPALAEEIAGDIRRTLVRRDVPATAATRWLLAPPAAPDRLEGRDVTLSVANGRLTFAYKRSARRKKKALGNLWSVPLSDIVDVEWTPAQRRARGFLRVTTSGTPVERPKPKHDPAAMLTEPGGDVDALFFAARVLTRIRP
ncbi:DUF4429 domain-containing protein [Kribbella sp. NBC_00709]|uniref:DUF4429 domain-containing protein n=1 Tax=Kribbella sp. NBC_00709 TaxID=2975972 RepID=UPI002E2D0E8B|nr:DUF4429 domain-containing protein [Kribbella sp. NBC_00709]